MMGEMFEITVDWINQNATPAGGYKNEQLRIIGVPIPPMRGWPRKMNGKLITQDQKLKFEAFHHGFKATKKSKQALGIDDSETLQAKEKIKPDAEKWVRISERLPREKEQPCLIAMSHSGGKHVYLSSEMHGLYLTPNGPVWYSLKRNEVSVFGDDAPPTHWMTVPHPPVCNERA